MNAIQLLQLPLFQGISEAAARQLPKLPTVSVAIKKATSLPVREIPAARSIYYVQETYVHKWKMRKGNKLPSTG